jgi:hypothetical protein
MTTLERYDHHEDGMEIARDGDFVSYDDYAALLARAEQAVARVAELEGALQFYADPDIYESNQEPPYQGGFTPIETDNGERARRALSREEPKP